MSETPLGRLNIDSLDDKASGVGAAKVVELNPFQVRRSSGRIPDPMQPVRVVQVLAVKRWEDKRLSIFSGEVEL